MDPQIPTQTPTQPKPPDAAASPPAAGAPPAHTAQAPAGSETSPPASPDPNTKEGRWAAEQRAREAKLVRDQQTFARQRDEFENYKRQMQAEIDEARAIKQRIRQDAVGLAKDYGWDEDRLAARVLNGGKPTQLDKEAERDRELSELRKWRESQEQARLAQEQQRAQAAAREAFAVTAQDANRWPLASQVKKDRLIAKGEQIALEHARNGVQLSDEDILDKLEEEYGEIASLQSKTAKQATSTAGDTAPQAKPGTDTQPAPTLTNGKAAEVAGQKGQLPVNMSFDEERAYLLRKLKEDRAKGLIVD